MQEDPDEYLDPRAGEIFKESDLMLLKPFDFYGLSLSLNSNDQIDLANRSHIRYYKMQVNELCREKEGLMAEMDAMRRLLNEIKASAENAQNRIQEYVIKESIAIEEMKQ